MKRPDNQMVSEGFLINNAAENLIIFKFGLYQIDDTVNSFLIIAAALNQYHFSKEPEHFRLLCFQKICDGLINGHNEYSAKEKF